MKLPRRQLSIRSLMIAIALVTTLVSVPAQGWRWGLRAKEEVRARWAVVDRLQKTVYDRDRNIEVKSCWLATAEQNRVGESMRAAWAAELAEDRSIADRAWGQVPRYRRLATYPWLAFPRQGEPREYLDESYRDYLNRTRERGSACLWGGGGAVGAVLLILIPLGIGVRLTRGADPRPTGPGSVTVE